MSDKKTIIRGIFGKPMSTKETVNEEILSETGREALLDKYLYAKGINPKYVTKDVRISHSKSGHFLKYQKDHQNDRDELPASQMEETDLTEDKKPATHEVYNQRTGERVGMYSSKNRARTAQDKHDNIYGSYVHRIRELPQKPVTPVAEEVLDELSKDTLSSYKKKATTSVGDMRYNARNEPLARKSLKLWHKADDRSANIDKASDRIKKEEIEIVDELSKPTMKNYAAKSAGEVIKNYGEKDKKDTVKKRADGINTAWRKISQDDKIKNEEIEPIDELSNATLKSYKSKALAQGTAARSQNKYDDPPEETRVKNRKLMFKRSDGMDKADSKMTREEIESIDELNRDTLNSYRKKASASADKSADTLDKTIKTDPTAANAAADTHIKRIKGLNRADDRLNSEATQDNGGLGGSDLIEKKSKAQTIKDLVKKNRLGEAQQPKMNGKEFDKKLNADDETNARAVLKGGTTLTGEPRDTIIIDPSLRKPTTKGMNKQPDFPEKDQKSGPR